MSPEDSRHGTNAGYQVHRRHGEDPCPPCRKARAEYMRTFRKGSTKWREQSAARSRALWALAATHRDEFERLYVLERMKDRAAS